MPPTLKTPRMVTPPPAPPAPVETTPAPAPAQPPNLDLAPIPKPKRKPKATEPDLPKKGRLPGRLAAVRAQAVAIAAERRLATLKLIQEGWRTPQIAKHLGVAERTVIGYRQEAIEALRQETLTEAEPILALEISKLDRAEQTVWAILDNPKSKPGAKLAAADRLIKLSERRCKLRGVEAPARLEHSGPGGGPIQQQHAVDLTKLSDSDLSQLERIARFASN